MVFQGKEKYKFGSRDIIAQGGSIKANEFYKWNKSPLWNMKSLTAIAIAHFLICICICRETIIDIRDPTATVNVLGCEIANFSLRFRQPIVVSSLFCISFIGSFKREIHLKLVNNWATLKSLAQNLSVCFKLILKCHFSFTYNNSTEDLQHLQSSKSSPDAILGITATWAD